MLTLVSKPDTPVLPIALGPVLSGGAEGQGDDALRAFLRGGPWHGAGAADGMAAAPVDPGDQRRTARSRWPAMLWFCCWMVHAAADAGGRHAVRSAAALARTGRNTEVVSLGRDCPGADHAIPGVENAFSERRALPMPLRRSSAASQGGRRPGGVWAFRADA